MPIHQLPAYQGYGFIPRAIPTARAALLKMVYSPPRSGARQAKGQGGGLCLNMDKDGTI